MLAFDTTPIAPYVHRCLGYGRQDRSGQKGSGMCARRDTSRSSEMTGEMDVAIVAVGGGVNGRHKTRLRGSLSLRSMRRAARMKGDGATTREKEGGRNPLMRARGE